jgi:hypothetical protein
LFLLLLSILLRAMRDFAGMEDADPVTRAALLDFR